MSAGTCEQSSSDICVQSASSLSRSYAELYMPIGMPSLMTAASLSADYSLKSTEQFSPNFLEAAPSIVRSDLTV
jgi:hypothetical protein